jgi:hypothetical protein
MLTIEVAQCADFRKPWRTTCSAYNKHLHMVGPPHEGEPLVPYLLPPSLPPFASDVLLAEVAFCKPPASEPIAFVTPVRAPVTGLLPFEGVPPPVLVGCGMNMFPDFMSGPLDLVPLGNAVGFEVGSDWDDLTGLVFGSDGPGGVAVGSAILVSSLEGVFAAPLVCTCDVSIFCAVKLVGPCGADKFSGGAVTGDSDDTGDTVFSGATTNSVGALATTAPGSCCAVMTTPTTTA